jgi:hypothetical protein
MSCRFLQLNAAQSGSGYQFNALDDSNGFQLFMPTSKGEIFNLQ